MKYRKKPVIIEAIQYTGDNYKEICDFVGKFLFQFESGEFVIETLEGDHLCKIGDFVIKGVRGEFYVCKPYIFEETYEEVK